MSTTTKKPNFTHSSYKAACAALKSGKAKNACWDSGEGFYSTGYWCDWRKRVIATLFCASGERAS
jgi:hypothetical protein